MLGFGVWGVGFRISKRLGFGSQIMYTGTQNLVGGAIHGGFPKLGIPFWRTPMNRTIIFCGLCWDPLFMETDRHYSRFSTIGFLGSQGWPPPVSMDPN